MKFEDIGSFEGKSGREGMPIASTAVEEVAKAKQKKTRIDVGTCSTRKISGSFDMPVSTMHKLLRNILHCF